MLVARSDSQKQHAIQPLISADVLIGRQPIYDKNRKVHGFELLYRSSQASRADVLDGDEATARVILNSIVDVGLDTIAPNGLLFINCTRAFLKSGLMLPPDRCVLEVLETVELDTEVVSHLKELKSRGFRIALDDFEYAESKSSALEIADYVKVDVAAWNRQELRALVAKLKRFPGRLLAEKVEDEAMMKYCQQLGFTLFQGYYLKRPDVLTQKRITANRLAGLKVVAECQRPDSSIAGVAATVAGDVGLTYSLLRLANSAMYGTRREVTSITEAVGRLGTENVMRWATLLLMANEADCPGGYIETALQRARMCELLAALKVPALRESCFLVGLLSVLDSVTGVVLEKLLSSVPLSDAIKRALLHRQGECGNIYQIVLDYENGNWAKLSNAGFDESGVLQAFWTSADFATETFAMLSTLGAPKRN